jgi:guanosine-3',5'-bis(diphosphate) 3'-pyrophosphohydrolase
MDDETGLLLKAIAFSAEKHRAQRRKGPGDIPYINHPLQVAQTLWETGGVRDVATLLAAVLHDTLEDTQTTPDELRHLFGEEVLSIVEEVTDDKALPKETRKLLQIEHAPHISAKAKLVKLADKICNLADIIANPPENWPFERRQAYVIWTEQVIAGLRGTNPALEKAYDGILAEGKRVYQIQ